MANPKDAYLEDVETAVSKPRKSKASPRPRSASKKSKGHGSAKGLPYRSGAASGSTSTRTARELWLSAVKNGTGNSPRKNRQKTPTELWNENLRHAGVGIKSQSVGNMDSFSGLSRNQSRNMGYSSTSHFLRQKAGTEKGNAHYDSPGKSLPGTPAYKSREEYYDEVLALKKQIQGLNSENSTQKSKIRRLEEDNIKKEKEIDQLLDPSKSEDIRRTLSDRKPDTSTVIHSLKQKILKLEHQLKEKELAFNKLQSDLKTTKHEEVKVQLETFYKEIVRLNQIKTLPQESQLSRTAPVSSVKETPSRLRALQDTIKRMNEKNIRLMSENKTLREDLDKMMEDKAMNKEKHREYEDMSKNELMGALTKLEKRLDRAEADNFSIVSDVDNRRSDTEGKIVLEGTVAQRLDQLDKRETELLEEVKKLRANVKQLQKDRVHYRKRTDEKEKEIKTLKKEIEELQAELDGFYDKDKSITPRRTPRQHSAPKPKERRGPDSGMTDRERRRRAEQMRENHAAKQIQRGWRSHNQDEAANQVTSRVEEMRQIHSAKVIQSSWRGFAKDKQEQKVQKFKEERAARKIQSGWVDHKHRKIEAETEHATELIQGAIRGHRARQVNMSRMRGYMAEPDEATSVTMTATESELEDAADTIQTSMRGYQYQKKHIQRLKKKPPIPKPRDPYNDDDLVFLQANFRGHITRKTHLKSQTARKAPPRSSFSRSSPNKRLDSEGEEEEDTTPPPSARRMFGRTTPTGRLTPSSNKFSLASGRATPASGRATPTGRQTPTGRMTPASGRNTPQMRPASASRRTRTPSPGFGDSDSDDDDIVMPARKLFSHA